MEQIHEFITKEIIEIELIQKEENKRNLILEGHNDGPAISPTKNRPLTPNMPRGRLDGSLKLKKKGL